MSNSEDSAAVRKDIATLRTKLLENTMIELTPEQRAVIREYAFTLFRAASGWPSMERHDQPGSPLNLLMIPTPGTDVNVFIEQIRNSFCAPVERIICKLWHETEPTFKSGLYSLLNRYDKELYCGLDISDLVIHIQQNLDILHEVLVRERRPSI